MARQRYDAVPDPDGHDGIYPQTTATKARRSMSLLRRVIGGVLRRLRVR